MGHSWEWIVKGRRWMYDRKLYWSVIRKKIIGLVTSPGVLLPGETTLDHACVVVEAFEMCSVLWENPNILPCGEMS